MFDRVKAYIAISFFTTSQIAIVCIFLPHTFRSHTYDIVEDIMRFEYWGFIFAAIALGYVAALVAKSLVLARAVGSISAGIMAMWGISFAIEAILGHAHGPTAAIVWLTLAAKDIVIISTPVIEPIEELVTRDKRFEGGYK